jgi:hypothetical protein
VTALGKTLVLLQVAFSLGLMTLAMGLYWHRIDWSNTKATAEREEGELAKRQEKLREAQSALATRESRWEGGYTPLMAAEKRRPDDQQWYANQLKHLEEEADQNDPVKVVVLQPANGQAELDRDGRPKLQAHPDNLLSRSRYLAAIASTNDAINQERAAFKLKSIELTGLTIRLQGDGKDKKGLRQQYEDAIKQYRDVEQEQHRLTAPLINTTVEAQLLVERRAQLKLQVEQLERVFVAGRKP